MNIDPTTPKEEEEQKTKSNMVSTTQDSLIYRRDPLLISALFLARLESRPLD
jgi:hypothetical protein